MVDKTMQTIMISLLVSLSIGYHNLSNAMAEAHPQQLSHKKRYTVQIPCYKGCIVRILKSSKDAFAIATLKDLEKNTDKFGSLVVTYICRCLKNDHDETREALTRAISHNHVPVSDYVHEQYINDEFYLAQDIDTCKRFCVHKSWLRENQNT